MTRGRTPIVEAGWLAALALTPVVVDPWSDPSGDLGKPVILRLLVLMILGGWLASAAGPRVARSRVLPAIVVCWLAAHALATATALSPAVSLLGGTGRGQGLATIAAYAVLLLVARQGLGDRARRERAVTVILITSTSVAIYGLIQRLWIEGTPWSRPGATLGGAIFLGAYFAMTAPLALARLLDNARLRHRATAVAYAAVFALQSAALVLTMSRGPFLGFLAALITLALLDARMGGARRAALWLAPCAMAGLVTSAAGQSFPRLVDPGGDTTRVRVLIWEATMRLVGPHEPLWSPAGDDGWHALRPLVGYGPESLYAALGPFRPDELARREHAAKPDRAHNAVLDALATTGVLGALAYLALVTGVLATGLRRQGLLPPGAVPRFVAWCAAGSIGAAVVAFAGVGPGWVAPAFGWGLAAGSLAFVTRAGRSRAADDDLTSAALLAGAVGHVVETQVGFATTSTWLHFAFFAGALAADPSGDASDDADRISLHGVLTGVVLCALLVPMLGSDDVWGTGLAVLIGGTTLIATLLVSLQERPTLRDVAWLVTLALALPTAFALPVHMLARRAGAGQPDAVVYATSFFVAYVGIGVLLAARALRGEAPARGMAPRRRAIVAWSLVGLVALIEVTSLQGRVLGSAGTRSALPVEQRIPVLERAQRLQRLTPRADALVGLAYLSLAEKGPPQPALERARDAFSRAQWLDPFDADHTIDLARFDRATARLLPENAADRLASAIDRYEAAARLDPAARGVHQELAATLDEHARVLATAGDVRAAAAERERADAARRRAHMLQPVWAAYNAPTD